MKTIVGVYETPEMATEALEYLKEAGYATDNLQLINRDELLHNHISIRSNSGWQAVEILAGAAMGAITGGLMAMHVFDMPVLHFLYLNNPVEGALTGGILGTWVSAMITILSSFASNSLQASKFGGHLNGDKYILFAQGSRAEISRAHQILSTPDMELELD